MNYLAAFLACLLAWAVVMLVLHAIEHAALQKRAAALEAELNARDVGYEAARPEAQSGEWE